MPARWNPFSNFPVALKNCTQMVDPGGQYATITPANNVFGHGFYQLEPDFVFRSRSETNGSVSWR